MYFYSCNNVICQSEDYIFQLNKRYKNLTEGLKKAKGQEYVELFEKHTKNIRETFKSMKENSDKKKLINFH